MLPTKCDDAIVERLLEQLAEGKSLLEICRDPQMPAARTILRWSNANDELAQRIHEAREVGFWLETDRLMEEMRTCPDAQRARNILDATRWRLGKLSNAFREKPSTFGVQVNVDVADAFDAIARVLDQAAGRISDGRSATRRVVAVSEAGPADPAG